VGAERAGSWAAPQARESSLACLLKGAAAIGITSRGLLGRVVKSGLASAGGGFLMPAMKQEATRVFHAQPDNLNCAQAVLHAYQAKTGDRALSVPEYRAFGGGRAPEGECGALYAACQCAPESAAQLREGFRAKAGATQCRALKQELKFPCPSCVGLGAELLDQVTKR
jgi:hypothetical protein